MTDDTKRRYAPENASAPSTSAPSRANYNEGQGHGGTSRPGERSERGDRPERSDRGSRPERSDRAPRKEYGDRPDRGSRPERTERGDRPDRGERGSRGDRPQRSDHTDNRPRGATGALIELDRDLMKLLVRRATLVSRIREGRDHAAGPAAIQAEKAVRMAWETNALAFSKDPRFTRQLFTMLQDLKVLTKEQSDSKTSFNLAPAARPVGATITGPASCRTAQMWLTLAACLGKSVTLQGVMLSDALMDAAKACNQAGAALTWESHGTNLGSVTAAEAKPANFAGRTLNVGDDLFTLYLLTFMAIGQVGSCRFTGGAPLKAAELNGLRNTLPLLGARLAHVVPRSQGLPATLESSGAIPQNITVPADLPLDGVCALLLAPMVWAVPVTINLAALPAGIATAALAEVGPIHRDAGTYVENHGSSLVFTPGPLALPQHPSVPLDPALSAYLLALPAFAGGSLTLKGIWPTHLPEAHEAAALLGWAGLDLAITEGSVVAAPSSKQPFGGSLQCNSMTPALGPLFFALTALHQKQVKKSLPVQSMTDEDESVLAQDFFSRIGLSLDEGLLFSAPVSANAESGESDSAPAVWTSPDAYWSMALALSAFLKPGLQLSNPGNVTEVMPPFWNIYNNLPHPADPALPPRAKAKDPADDKPVRRRIIAE